MGIYFGREPYICHFRGGIPPGLVATSHDRIFVIFGGLAPGEVEGVAGALLVAD